MDIEGLIKGIPQTSPESAGGEKYRSVDDAESRLADLRAKQSQMRRPIRRPARQWLL